MCSVCVIFPPRMRVKKTPSLFTFDNLLSKTGRFIYKANTFFNNNGLQFTVSILTVKTVVEIFF